MKKKLFILLCMLVSGSAMNNFIFASEVVDANTLLEEHELLFEVHYRHVVALQRDATEEEIIAEELRVNDIVDQMVSGRTLEATTLVLSEDIPDSILNRMHPEEEVTRHIIKTFFVNQITREILTDSQNQVIYGEEIIVMPHRHLEEAFRKTYED